MKKIIFQFLFLIYSAILAQNAISRDTVKYEAEAAKYDSLLKQSDINTSSGEYLKMGNKGSIVWEVNVDADSWYALRFRYKNSGSENEEYIVRNGYKFAVGFPGSKNWNLFDIPTFLKRGLNKIELLKSWGNIDLDYLQIFQIHLNPELTPGKNIFYKEFPRDLSIKVNRFGSQILKVICNKSEIPFSISEYPFQEDAVNIKFTAETFSQLPIGIHDIQIIFNNGNTLHHEIIIAEKSDKHGITIIAPYVEHGKSIIVILPTGKTLLIDCGKDWVRDSLIIPFINRNRIEKINYFFLTHYHEDHDSGDKGEKIKMLFNVDHFYDYKTFHSGDSLLVEGVCIKILNSYDDGDDENTRSLSLKLKYNGFIYVDGGDTYGINQQKILAKFPGDIKADVFAANHHFHGSANVDYLRAMNPSLVLIQSQEAIYARSTYMIDFLKNVKGYLNLINQKKIEGLAALEVGTIVIRVNDKNNFEFETYSDYKNCIIPYIQK